MATNPDVAMEKARRRFLMVWTAVGAILLTGAAVYLINILSVPIGILLWTLVIVFCLRGTVNKLESKGVPRPAGTGIAYLLMFAVLAIVSFLMLSPAFGFGEQFTDLVQSIPGYINDFMGWANGVYARYSDVFQNNTVQAYMNEALSSMGSAASDVARQSATGVVAIGAGVVNTGIAVGFALVIAFWILIELPALGRETMRLAGPSHRETMEFFHATCTRVMGGYLKGTLLQCAVIGVGCGILFQVVGVPNAAVLGLITGVMNIIPIIGPWLGGALAAIAAVFVSPLVALIALAGTVVIQQLVYTFVSPKIMANSVDIHPALTLIALMVGSALGGAMSGLMGSLVGMLASIPLVAVAKSVFVYYLEKKTGRHLVAEDGVFFQGTPRSDGSLDPIADATSPHPDASTGFSLPKVGRGKEQRRDGDRQ